MNLDITNGKLEITRDLTIYGGYTFESFKNSPFYSGQDGIGIIRLNGTFPFGSSERACVSLFFREGVIYMVSLICLDIAPDPENEPKRRKLHDDLLEKLGIPQKKYDWGAVKSAYDGKSNISSIDILYEKEKNDA